MLFPGGEHLTAAVACTQPQSIAVPWGATEIRGDATQLSLVNCCVGAEQTRLQSHGG